MPTAAPTDGGSPDKSSAAAPSTSCARLRYCKNSPGRWARVVAWLGWPLGCRGRPGSVCRLLRWCWWRGCGLRWWRRCLDRSRCLGGSGSATKAPVVSRSSYCTAAIAEDSEEARKLGVARAARPPPPSSLPEPPPLPLSSQSTVLLPRLSARGGTALLLWMVLPAAAMAVPVSAASGEGTTIGGRETRRC